MVLVGMVGCGKAFCFAASKAEVFVSDPGSDEPQPMISLS